MSEDFVGQTALVTGSTCGIGRAVAEQLAARVLVSDRDQTCGACAVTKIRSLGEQADFLANDFGQINSVRALASNATELAAMVRSTFDQNHHTVPTYRPQELPHGPSIARPLSLGLRPGC